VQDLATERAPHLKRAFSLRAAADADVAGAVDREGVVAVEALCEQITEQALGEAAAVEADARWSEDGVGPEVDAQKPPVRCRVGSCGGARRRVSECATQVGRVGDVGRVSGVLDRAEQRRVDQAARQLRGAARELGKARHLGTDGDGVPRVGVHQRQLAVGSEARELAMPALELHTRRRDGVLRASTDDEDRAERAEARERRAGLVHDC
jgi:hypothetical protein